MTNEKKLCPSCGCETLYAKYAVTGTAIALFNVEEETQDFSGFHDRLKYRCGKYLRCVKCDAVVCEAKDLNLSEFEPVY